MGTWCAELHGGPLDGQQWFVPHPLDALIVPHELDGATEAVVYELEDRSNPPAVYGEVIHYRFVNQ